MRSEIDRLVARGEAGAAVRRLAELWRREATHAAASFVVSRFERLGERAPLTGFRLAILRSFTVEPLVPLLRAACFCAGLDVAVHVGEFNAYAQELLDPQSALDGFGADAVFLAVQSRDIAPDLWQDFASLSEAERAGAVARVEREVETWVRAFRRESAAPLVVHTLEEPAAASLGVLDAQLERGQRAAFAAVNAHLRRLCAEVRGLYLLDYDGLVARHGRALWHDERKWQAARMPLAAASLASLVQEWMRFVHPLAGRVAKAVAVDLDNTLWGGVVGEDGPEGVRVGPEPGGAAYLALQRALLDLRARGVLLCVCSKNNPAEALDVLERHPGMLLRPHHFAAMRINWEEKARNLRELARELNIGTDALAFIDDNPVEREHVRAELPEAWVIELSQEPSGYAEAVRGAPIFERLVLLEEDRARADYYAAARERDAAVARHATREDFLRELRQEVEVAPLTPRTLARVAQLTQKTNQFNLTTRRYTEQQLEALARAGQHVFTLRVRDRFGDNGLVGAAIALPCAEVWEIDTFLLSCRVIGRTVETALLAHLAGCARRAGAARLRGWFRQTPKNAPARDFYAVHGFSPVEETERGTLWELDLRRQSVDCPDWIQLTAADGEQP